MSDPDTSPVVSVVIPTLEEEEDIAGCLESVARQDYPLTAIEVILVDGCSLDRTREVAKATAESLGLNLRVFENPFQHTSTSLNVGLDRARGRFIVRLDARSRVQPHYVRTCLRILDDRPDVGVVGGAQVSQSRSEALVHRGIARALANRYATGLARYRLRSASGPTDTVWMGCFRSAELRHLGGWSAEIIVNEDWELNERYRSEGLLVWFEQGLDSGYLPRADLPSLARQYYSFGRAKGRLWMRGMRPVPRQIALLIGPPAAGAALLTATRRRRATMLAAVPALILLVDMVGVDEPAPPAVRVASGAAIGTYSGAWWLGTLVGASSELIDRFQDRR